MTPERWQQIDNLFHSVLELPLRERAEFLAKACRGDKFLRSEVESLIDSHEVSDSFFDKPAEDLAAEFFEASQTRLQPGQLLGHYTIASLLGKGGMGEVYLARDEKLGRQIAIKLLPIEFTNDRERVRRFELEARAASALNHPNIVTIYEIGESDSSHFIATEFIDGQTLRQYMAGSTGSPRLDIKQVLDIAIQIGSALAAAHSDGIVHRDIKPENIMLRADGFVKVLDFGLAKLGLEQTGEIFSEAAPLSMGCTNPGVVMGTVRYMSPEQAKGIEVDSRTDIWSLGVVVYEMITGRGPFHGETPNDVIASILKKKPPLLSRFAVVPEELERICAKTLSRDRGYRYQLASDLVADLKRLRRDIETEEGMARTSSARHRRTRRVGSAAAAPAPAELATTHVSAFPTVRLEVPQSTNEYLQKISTNKKAAALVLVILLLAGGFGLYKLLRRNRTAAAPPIPFQAIELLRLTNSGRVNDSAISPDGRYVAYVIENAGKQSIWVRNIADSNNLQVVPPGDAQYYGGTFSRDSSELYYIAKERNNSIGVLYRVPALGGTPVKLIEDVDGPITLSPDEKRLAFVRGSSTGERALMLANADGSNEHKLASRMGYEAFSFGGPAWSPNGNGIVTGAAYTEEKGRYLTVVEVNVADGSVKPVTSQRWKGIGRISYLQDGKGIVFTAAELGAGSTSQLWYMNYPSGQARRISRDLQDYHGASLTADAKTLVTKQTQTLSSLWIAPNSDADRANEILSHKEDDDYSYSYSYRTRFSWMQDNRIMYTSLVDGVPKIFVMNAAGADNKQLTDDSSDSTFPSVTRDSRYVIFVSERSGFSNVWRMDLNGGNQKQLTTGQDESWSWASPDNQWVVYHSGNQGKRTLWRVSTEGGKAEQLTNYPSVCPVVSPDGQWVSTYYRLETKAPWRLGIVPFNGGPPVRSFEVPDGVLFQSLVRWTPDGSSLAYIRNQNGVSNIWVQPLDGEPARQLTKFKTDQIFWFEWSPDGKQLGVSRGAISSDVVMIRR
ncbi:MAG TPA: protein kinase [Pyrinomonadaceae bacterium]|nr:protein kinase [Pyrinomonadaceae bacterium]